MARSKNFDESATLDKAVELFRKQGYKATTPAQIVAYLDISRSSLYDTYGDKRELYIKALQRYSEATTKNLSHIAETAVSAKKGIREFFQIALESCFGEDAASGCMLINSLAELPPEETALTEMINHSIRINKQTLIKLVKKGQAQAEIPEDISATGLAEYFMNAICGLTISSKSGVSKKTCQQIIDRTLSVLY